jgi:hypothetical protein
MRWRLRWQAAASQRLSTRIKGVSSPHPSLFMGCRLRRFRSFVLFSYRSAISGGHSCRWGLIRSAEVEEVEQGPQAEAHHEVLTVVAGQDAAAAHRRRISSH